MKANIRGYSRTPHVLPHLVVVDLVFHPGDVTPFHDHTADDGGPVYGIVFVRRGRLFEIAEDGAVTFHEQGSCFMEGPNGFMHVVGNCGGEDAESTHMYFPSLRMKESPYPEPVIAALHALGITL